MWGTGMFKEVEWLLAGDTESRCELANSPTCSLHLHTMIHRTLGLKLLPVFSSVLLQQQSRHFPDWESKYLKNFRLTYTKKPQKHYFGSTPRCWVNNNRILPYWRTRKTKTLYGEQIFGTVKIVLHNHAVFLTVDAKPAVQLVE